MHACGAAPCLIQRSGWHGCRFMVFELAQPASSAGHLSPLQQLPHPHLLGQAEVPDSSPGVHSMGWVGGQLAVCAGMRYLLVSPFGPVGSAAAGGSGPGSSQWRELLAVPEELAYSPAMLAPLPDLGRAVLVVVSRRPGAAAG